MAPTLPAPYHLGIVVRDLAAATDLYGSIYGIDRWMYLDTDYQARHHGRDTHVANHNAFGYSGSMMLELVEPGIGDTPAADFLTTRGEGVFHLGYSVDDPLDPPAGTEPCFEVLLPDTTIVYLDTIETLGYYLELVPHPVVDALTARVRAVTDGLDDPAP